MGEITDALRAGLRELAQSDARLLRELDAVLPGGAAPIEAPAAAVIQLDDGLERLSLKDLKDLCKQRRIKGIAKLKKDELIALLRAGTAAAPAALPASGRAGGAAAAALAPAVATAPPVAIAPAAGTAPAAAPPVVAATAPASAAGLAALEARLERMETLLQRIAAQLGVA